METGASPFSVENLPSWPRPAGCLGALSSDQRIIKHVHNRFFSLFTNNFQTMMSGKLRPLSLGMKDTI